MTQETLENSDKNPDYRKLVGARVKKEAAALIAAEKKKKPSNRDTTSFDFRCFELNELGDGLVLADATRDRFVYNNTTEEFLFLPEGGHHLERDISRRYLASVDTTVCKRYLDLADKLSERIGAAAKDNDKDGLKSLQVKREKIYKRVKQLRGVHRRNNCVQMSISNSYSKTISESEIDQKPGYVHGPNAKQSLYTGLLEPGRLDDYVLKAVPHKLLELEFSDTEKWFKKVCPKFIKFVSQIFDGEQSLVDYSQRALGMALFGEIVERVLFILFGPDGSNGKSLFANIICYTLGELASFIQPEILLDPGRFKNSSAPSPDIMSMKGLRVAFCSEPDEKQRFSIAGVKKLTGGDILRGRHPHDRLETTFRPSSTIFLLSNILPKVFINDPAFWSRLQVIPFPVSFVEHPDPEKKELPINKNLMNELKAEASGILAWMIFGSLEYQAQGLNPPALVRNSVISYRNDQDLLYGFLESCCLQGEDLSVGASDLYSAFESYYLTAIGRKAPRQKSFGTLVSKHFAKEKVSGYIRYIGLDLIPGWEKDDLGR